MTKKVHSHGGFTFETSRAPILSTPLRFAWKRELSCFQGQNLPEGEVAESGLFLVHLLTDSLFSTVASSLWQQLRVSPPRRVKRADIFHGVGMLEELGELGR